MPRRFHVESDDVLGAASMVAEMTESITDLLHVPIASTVASLISIILKAVKVSSQCYHIIVELLTYSLRMLRITTTHDFGSLRLQLHISRHFVHI